MKLKWSWTRKCVRHKRQSTRSPGPLHLAIICWPALSCHYSIHWNFGTRCRNEATSWSLNMFAKKYWIPCVYLTGFISLILCQFPYHKPLRLSWALTLAHATQGSRGGGLCRYSPLLFLPHWVSWTYTPCWGCLPPPTPPPLTRPLLVHCVPPNSVSNNLSVTTSTAQKYINNHLRNVPLTPSREMWTFDLLSVHCRSVSDYPPPLSSIFK